eukprot:4513082-Ditylum_brightwellii.AAC.1
MASSSKTASNGKDYSSKQHQHQKKTNQKQRKTQRNNAAKCSKTQQNNATKHNAMTLLTDDVLAKLVYKTLPIINSQPTYVDINKMSKMLYANATKVPTTLGGGNKGHIGHIMKALLYVTISTTAYVALTGPTMPTNVGSTTAERELALRQYKAEKTIFDNH